MNDMTINTGNGHATMSSREIADLCDKRHDNVVRDTETMLDALEMSRLNFEGTYSDAQGKARKCYNLPRDLTMTLVTGYSIPLRKKVIDRLDQLEKERTNPALALNDPAMLRHLLLENVEKVIALESRVQEMQSDVEALDLIAVAHGSMSRTEAAKHLGIPPHVLCKWMRTNGWTYRRAGTKDDLAYQSKMNAGYLEHKVNTGPRPDGTEWIGTQVRVTPKGLTVLAKAFPSAARAA